MAVNAVTMLCGDTGSGKSVLLATLAKWLWRTRKIVTRYYAFDPGGWSDEMQALIAAGVVEVWRPKTRDPDGASLLVSETLVRVSQGWWPVQVDPKDGSSPRACQLKPPAEDWRGTVMFDGITSMQAWSMVEMGVRAALGVLGGEGGNLKPVASGELVLGSGNRGSVGFTQQKAQDWIENSLTIRGLGWSPTFTALESKVTDDNTKLQMYGPKIAGSARTYEVPSWVGNLLGTVLMNGQWRLYLREYQWPAGDPTPHKCKVRVAAGFNLRDMPEYLADEVGEAALTKFNLGYFFELIEGLEKKAAEALRGELGEVPGQKESTYDKKPEARTIPAGGAPAAGAGGAASTVRRAPGLTRARPAPPAAPTPTGAAGGTGGAPGGGEPGPQATPNNGGPAGAGESKDPGPGAVGGAAPGAAVAAPGSVAGPEGGAGGAAPGPQAVGAGAVVRRPPPGSRPATQAPIPAIAGGETK